MDSTIAFAAVQVAASHRESGGGLLSGIVAQLWSHMNVALGKSVKESVEPMFKETLPAPLSTLHFTELDLGTVPIRLDNIIVHPLEGDSLQFDMDVIWDGDCNIQLKADYIGSFGVKQVKLKGRLSVLMSPLTHTMPVVSAIQYGFLNPPHVELDFLSLANVADFSMIDNAIRGIILDTISGMMVLPNRMLYKMDPTASFLDIYKPPIGVARVTVVKADRFDDTRGFLSDVQDPYCKVRLGNNKKYRTKTKNNTLEPEWNETVDFLLFDYDQVIGVEVLDHDFDIDGDDDLGSAHVSVREMLLAGKTKTLNLHRGTNGGRVTLRCDLCDLTRSNLESLESNDDENLLSGLMTILVVGALDIPLPKEDASCFVKVKYGENKEFVTGTVVDAPGVDALNPVYDCAFHVPLRTNNMVASIEFQLVNGKDDSVLGTATVTYDDLLNADNKTITEQRKIGDQGASLDFRVSLQGVQPKGDVMVNTVKAGSATATSSFVTASNAIGTVRLTAIKGWGFEVEKKARLLRTKKDVPDVYCHITFGSSPTVWKTTTIQNSTTPEWNESNDYLLSDHGQIINITVFDEDSGKRDQDDELGSARIPVGKLLLAAGGSIDVELHRAGKPTGQYIALRCDMVESS